MLYRCTGLQEPLMLFQKYVQCRKDRWHYLIRWSWVWNQVVGKITSAEFKAKLGESEVKVDDHINNMIMRHQAGDSVSYNAFGTYIFRQLNGRQAINTVDKITRNDVKIVAVEKI